MKMDTWKNKTTCIYIDCNVLDKRIIYLVELD